MSKKKKSGYRPASSRKPPVMLFVAVALMLLAAIAFLVYISLDSRTGSTAYKEKIALLRESALTQETRDAIGSSPAGSQARQVVFISICDTEHRASVFTGAGSDLDAAWKAADKKVQKFLANNYFEPEWVKADVVSSSREVSLSELTKEVIEARHEFYRYGVAFDPMYETALLEAEMNGAKIFAYDDRENGIDFEYLNNYLRRANRAQLKVAPSSYTLFQTYGWFCDSDNQVYPLAREGLEYGRREIELIDADYTRQLLVNAGDFLLDQVNEDGSFIYGIYPRFDNDIENYNIVRHTSTLWSLVCLYRVTGDEALVDVIENAIDYMLEYVIYDENGAAYLYEEKDDEIKLGGNGVALINLTEYMDAFQNTKYLDVCRALGEGILNMFDMETGAYYHILNSDFTRKEEYRTVYYDGEATFGLARLYGLTGEDIWLDAAKKAVDHFIEADYTQYKDHWVAYSVNEVTKHVSDPDYFTFGLRNAQENLKEIKDRDTTYHTYLEMLMASFQLYDRMVTEGISSEYLENEFSISELLNAIYARADRMLNGYVYPEYAMYMKNPKRILDTFMVRHDGYRVRIDDVQHNIGAYYQYYKNYDKMVGYGLLEARDH